MSHFPSQIKEEQLDQGQGGGDAKNECDSTRNGDALNSGDEDSNHRCEIIETKPVSLNAGQNNHDGNDSNSGSMDINRMAMGLGDMGGGGMGGNGLGGGNGNNGGGGGGGNGNPGWEMMQLGRLREAFGNNCGNPGGSSGFFNGIFANALGCGGAAGKMNSLMTGAGFHGSSSGGGGGGGDGGYPSPGHPSNQLPGIAQSFSNAPAWAAGSMDMSNLFRNRTQFSDEQVAVLKAYYDVDKYPNAMRVAEIAAKIGVHVRVVNVWFQNSRAKEKRNMKWPANMDGPNLPPPASGGPRS